VHGAQAKRENARAGAGGQQKRIEALPRSASAKRDRTQTITRAGRASAWREGKGRGRGPPAV
jgi:hypothetical protein